MLDPSAQKFLIGQVADSYTYSTHFFMHNIQQNSWSISKKASPR